MSVAIPASLISIEDFLRLPANGRPRELVRGRIEEAEMPGCRHGYVCSKIDRAVGTFVEAHDLGSVMTCDTFVVTGRDPDTVRGSDICYFSYGRLAKGMIPEGVAQVAPELVFEVKSPSDRWVKILMKAAEYLDAGVAAVCIVDPEERTVSIYRPDQNARTLTSEFDLTLPDILPGFSILIAKLFD